jgi:hypothetical protein
MLEDFLKRCNEMGIAIEGEQKDVDQLHDLVTCSDKRYIDYDSAIIILIFLKNNAIQTESFGFSIPMPSMKEVRGERVKDVEKAVMTQLLKSKGYDVEGYEIDGVAGIADLQAHKGQAIVIGECGACRITKVLQALSQDNTELWHLPYPKRIDAPNGIKSCSGSIHVYRRGPKWSELYREYNGSRFDKVAKTQSKLNETNSF